MAKSGVCYTIKNTILNTFLVKKVEIANVKKQHNKWKANIRTVTKPAQTPASIAAKRAKNGWPARDTIAPTVQPKVKHPSVVRSAILRIVKEIKSANATRAYIHPSSNALMKIETVKILDITQTPPLSVLQRSRRTCP